MNDVVTKAHTTNSSVFAPLSSNALIYVIHAQKLTAVDTEHKAPTCLSVIKVREILRCVRAREGRGVSAPLFAQYEVSYSIDIVDILRRMYMVGESV